MLSEVNTLATVILISSGQVMKESVQKYTLLQVGPGALTSKQEVQQANKNEIVFRGFLNRIPMIYFLSKQAPQFWFYFTPGMRIHGLRSMPTR